MCDAGKIIEAFAVVEKHELKVSTIVCTICGSVLSEANNTPCEHLLEIARSLNTKDSELKADFIH